MPKQLEQELTRRANKKGLMGESRKAYIYGSMRKMGWKPSTQKNSSPMDSYINDKYKGAKFVKPKK